MRIRSVAICLALFFSQSVWMMSGWALPELEVTGIMSGDMRVAVVNDKVLRSGDVVEGYTVQEIGADYVRFRAPDGGDVIKRLQSLEKVKTARPVGPVPAVNRTSAARREAVSVDPAHNVLRNIDAASLEVSKAEVLLKKPVRSVALYQDVLSLYENAEKELQDALDRSFDDELRKKIKAAIDDVRDDKNDLYQKRKALENAIAEAVKMKTVALGMTKSDVIQSLGRADRINKANYAGSLQDQWIYEVPFRGSVYLYFDNDVLTSTQY